MLAWLTMSIALFDDVRRAARHCVYADLVSVVSTRMIHATIVSSPAQSGSLSMFKLM